MTGAVYTQHQTTKGLMTVNSAHVVHDDGVAPHFTITPKTFLNDKYPEQCIGHGAPTACPTISTDLNLMVFFYFWSHLKKYCECHDS
jgi:hypothetical protein